jgi:hypothetical protein
MHLPSVFALVCFLDAAAFVQAKVLPRQSATELYRLPGEGARIQTIVAKEDGHLLLSRFDVPEIWDLDPSTGEASSLVAFPGYQAVTGVTETAPNVFVVATGNASSTAAEPNTWGIWSVDLTGATPQTDLVLSVPESQFILGLVAFNSETVYVADAGKGALYSLSLSTGDYDLVLQDDTMKAPANTTFAEGIHGLKFFAGYLWFTNTLGNGFHRISTDSETGLPLDPVQTILDSIDTPQDFIVGPDPWPYVTSRGRGEVVYVLPGRTQVVTAVDQPSSLTLGRGEGDTRTLYISSLSGVVYTRGI